MMHIVMEYCDGGDVMSLLEDSSISKAIRVRICLQAALGLKALHDIGIMHRDLKAENLVLKTKINSKSSPDDVLTKLADFGLARKESRLQSMTMTVGTPEMLAPECLLSAGDYGMPSDIFMFGLTVMQVFGLSTDPDVCRNDNF